MAKTTALHEYLNTSRTKERLLLLEKMKEEKEVLPIHLVADLMHAKLYFEEHILLLSVCETKDKLAFEDLVTRGLYLWDQNVSSKALRIWAKKTDCLLWHRCIPLSCDSQISQRLSYTLLDLAWFNGGKNLLESFSQLDGLEDMSPSFLALLFQRALIFDFECERLIDIGEDLLKATYHIDFKGDKVIPYIIAYFMKFRPRKLVDGTAKQAITGVWRDIIGSLQAQIIDAEYIKRLERTIKRCSQKKGAIEDFYTDWPSIWNRGFLPEKTITKAMKLIAGQKITHLKDQRQIYEIFGGISSETLYAACEGVHNSLDFCHIIGVLGNLLTSECEGKVVSSLTERIKKEENPIELLTKIPQNYRVQLGEKEKKGTFASIFEEREVFKEGVVLDEVSDAYSFSPAKGVLTGEQEKRHGFIRVKSGTGPLLEEKKSTFWGLLAEAWVHPEKEVLEKLAKKARMQPAVFQVFYIETLGRFQNIDSAALKLLDFVRVEDPPLIRGLIQSLASINTQRSLQEVVAFLTRPNIKFDIQMDIAHLLAGKDLSQLQSELRSAIDDLYIDPITAESEWELKAALRDLIEIPLEGKKTRGAADDNMPTSTELDQLLAQKIEKYHKLSGETKRALRTAQFFHLQVQSAGNLKTIDLSPAIDMQYKALELAFRENFEAPCAALINGGSLQRRLDVIGYARPIPPAMEEFENYIENLPVIKSIPFFSRFKLRKMLRALCTYRKGKRFTLDGLKAFGLFFVCFSRTKCRYGLENSFPIEGMEDLELFEFAKALHIFQDFRNRAAHEGFHPDASNDLDGIWQDTIKIIDFMFSVKERLTITADQDKDSYHAAKEPKKAPIIVHKPAS